VEKGAVSLKPKKKKKGEGVAFRDEREPFISTCEGGEWEMTFVWGNRSGIEVEVSPGGFFRNTGHKTEAPGLFTSSWTHVVDVDSAGSAVEVDECFDS